MAKKKIHWLDEHPEIKSAIITFLTGFIPVFATQIGQVNTVDTLELGGIVGIIMVAVRLALKAGINALITWFSTKYGK